MLINLGDDKYLCTGTLLREPDMSTFGAAKYSKASMGVRHGRGDGDIVNVEAKFKLAECCRTLDKGDTVLAVCKQNSYETKDGKRRVYFEADFITAAGKSVVGLTEVSGTSAGFAEIDDDNLPFD